MCKIGDFVIYDEALARVDKKGDLDNWFKGRAYYDGHSSMYKWNITKDAPLFTLHDFNKIYAFKISKQHKQGITLTSEQKRFLQEAVYWCLAREGFDLSSLK